MFSAVRLNGWTRLFILISIIWVGSISMQGVEEVRKITETKAKHVADHRPDFFAQLSPAYRNFLVLDDASQAGQESFLITNDGDSRFQKLKVGVTETQARQVWDAYVEIADRVYRQERQRKAIQEHLFWAIFPCLLLGVFGLAVAWVIRGFKQRNQ